MKYIVVKSSKLSDEVVRQKLIEMGFTTEEEMNIILKNNQLYEEESDTLGRHAREEMRKLREKYSPLSLMVDVNSNKEFYNILKGYGFETLRERLNKLIDTFKLMGYERRNYSWLYLHLSLYFRDNSGAFERVLNQEFNFENTPDTGKAKELDRYCTWRAYQMVKCAIDWIDLVAELVELNKNYPHDQLMPDLKYVVHGTMHITPGAKKINPTNKTIGKIKIYVPAEMIEIHLFDKEKK